MPVEGLNGTLRFALFHIDKAKAAGLAGFTVHNKLDGFHFAVTFEERSNILLSGAEGQIPYIDRRHPITRLADSCRPKCYSRPPREVNSKGEALPEMPGSQCRRPRQPANGVPGRGEANVPPMANGRRRRAGSHPGPSRVASGGRGCGGALPDGPVQSLGVSRP